MFLPATAGVRLVVRLLSRQRRKRRGDSGISHRRAADTGARLPLSGGAASGGHLHGEGDPVGQPGQRGLAQQLCGLAAGPGFAHRPPAPCPAGSPARPPSPGRCTRPDPSTRCTPAAAPATAPSPPTRLGRGFPITGSLSRDKAEPGMPSAPRQPLDLYCWLPPPPSLMASLNCCDADWPLPSVTFIVNVKVPAALGVPASSLLLSLGA